MLKIEGHKRTVGPESEIAALTPKIYVVVGPLRINPHDRPPLPANEHFRGRTPKRQFRRQFRPELRRVAGDGDGGFGVHSLPDIVVQGFAGPGARSCADS